ncbi:early nodulin-like protein 4 [Musa acuminata AAA Group]|uniref:early nodulin-like protein 4 n=1 Tax=Musa acuminata AAA Group TaxID=214697 RepID=UPI0031DE32DD
MDSTEAYIFDAGGRDGWVLHSSESYGDWAKRNRFQVADTIVFKYEKGEDSVLVVSKQDYDAYDVSKPIQKLDGGDSVFKFDRSGPFYFISGTPGNCQRGQKLVVVVVMAVRHCPPISSPPSLPLSPPPVSSPASPPPPFPEPIIQPNTILNGPLAFTDVCCSRGKDTSRTLPIDNDQHSSVGTYQWCLKPIPVSPVTITLGGMQHPAIPSPA